jgi:hypothetical protein
MGVRLSVSRRTMKQGTRGFDSRHVHQFMNEFEENNLSKTPQTDSATGYVYFCKAVRAEFAQDLERSNNWLRAALQLNLDAWKSCSPNHPMIGQMRELCEKAIENL